MGQIGHEFTGPAGITLAPQTFYKKRVGEPKILSSFVVGELRVPNPGPPVAVIFPG